MTSEFNPYAETPIPLKHETVKESDPYAKEGQHGNKMDAGKVSYSKITPQALRNIAMMYNEPGVNPDLIFVHAIEPLIELARLFTRGCHGRYLPNSWKQVPDAINRYYDSGQRHREAYREGHVYDRDKVENGIEQQGTGIMSLVASLWAEYCRVYYVLKDLKERNEPLHVYDDRYTDKPAAHDCGCDGNCGDACKCEGGCNKSELEAVEYFGSEEPELKPDTGTQMHFVEEWLKIHDINEYKLDRGGDYPMYENCFVCGSGWGGHRLVDKSDNPGVCKTSFAICSNCYAYLENKIEEARQKVTTWDHPADQWLDMHGIDDYDLVPMTPLCPYTECCMCDGDGECHHWLESGKAEKNITGFSICDSCYEYLNSKKSAQQVDFCEFKPDKWLEEQGIEDYELVLGGNDTTIHKDCGICGGEAHSLVVDLSNDMGYPICGICFEYLQNMDGAQ